MHNNRRKSMTKINKSQYGILSLLSKKNMSGYDIKKMAQKVSPFHWSESNAQIYPILKKLENDQMVKSEIDLKSGDRNRRIYSITQQGRDHLIHWLKEPVEPSSYREEIILKLTAGENVETSIMIDHLEKLQIQIQELQKNVIEIQNDIEQRHEDENRKRYLLMAYDYAAMQLESKLSWCQKSLLKLKNLNKS